MKTSLGEKSFSIVNIAVLIVLCASILYPLYYMLIVSLSRGDAVMSGSVKFLPIGLTLETYKAVFKDPAIVTSYANTFTYTILGTIVNVIMTSLCAYPLSRSKLYGRTLFTGLVVFTMFFEGGIIPNYMVVNQLGLINTIWAIVIPPAINVWYMIIMRTFFQQIPGEIHESASMDGASEWTTFIRIIIPLSVPIVATMILFYAVWHWNSFFPALLYLNEKDKYPMQILLRNIVIAGDMATAADAAGGSSVLITGTNIKYAVVFITIFPILAVYPFIQKYFVKGMMVGSLKG